LSRARWINEALFPSKMERKGEKGQRESVSLREIEREQRLSRKCEEDLRWSSKRDQRERERDEGEREREKTEREKKRERPKRRGKWSN
jgi:hypothetical protein